MRSSPPPAPPAAFRPSPDHDVARPVRGRFSGLLAVGMVLLIAGTAQAAQVTLTSADLSQTYNGSPKSVRYTTVPAGLNAIVTYNGSTTRPVNAGSYTVVATIDDPVETGSATGTLVIKKANQVITLPDLPAKTYGDAPFFATASSNTGLPVAKWQSLDPAVATISETGEITLTGAGQSSIVAEFAESENYNAGWRAVPLNVARAELILPDGTNSVTYDGTPHGIDPTTLPAGLATQTTYRDVNAPTPTAVPEVVFQNGPDTLNLSYSSTSMAVNRYSALAKYVSLGRTARKLHSCDVTLVNWARYDNDPSHGYLSWANANPHLVLPPTPGVSIPGDSGGYYHPVTLSFYQYDFDGVTEVFRLLTSKTVNALIPWRPEKLANGNTYTKNGYAFRVPFEFPNGVILPPDVWISVGFNTQSAGTNPIGIKGPYNALNISNPDGFHVGTVYSASISLLFQDWRWKSGSQAPGPMLRLRAVPADASLEPPVNAGSYEVKTQAAAFEADGVSASALVIEKAPLVIGLDGLTHVRDGNPKPARVSTQPEGIATHVVYGDDLSPDAPSALGSYPVAATSANPNYQGEAQGILRIGDTFNSWQDAEFAGAGLSPEQIAMTGDADGDGLSNFLEYAAGLNPRGANHPRPSGFAENGDTLVFTYRKNPHALDLEYAIEHTTNLADPLAWEPVTPLQQNTVGEDGGGHLIEAVLEKPADPTAYFLRLKATRPPQP